MKFFPLFILLCVMMMAAPSSSALAQLSASEKKALEDAQAQEAQKDSALERALKKTKRSARKTKETKVRYAPDNCDFELTFPGQPYQSRRCPQGGSKCYPLTSYTMVYDLTSTVDVSVTCVPSTPANYKNYSERVIKTVLNGMVASAQLSDFTVTTQDNEDYRQGSAMGSGTYGKQERIYNAQIWIGQNSIFTVEAKLAGPSHPKADDDFSDILKSIHIKDDDEIVEKNVEEDKDDEDDDEDKDKKAD